MRNALIRVFQVMAIIEAVTWTGLLISMLFKYVLTGDQLGVRLFGGLHGFAMIGYVMAVFLVRPEVQLEQPHDRATRCSPPSRRSPRSGSCGERCRARSRSPEQLRSRFSVALAQSSPARIDVADHARKGQIFVALGAVAWSTAGLFQRDLSVGPATQLGGRAFFGMLSLFAFVAISQRRGGVLAAFRGIGRSGLVTALSMAIASGTFIIALNHTSVAHLLFILAISPLAAALIARVALGERVASKTWIAMLIALAGVVVMLGGGGGGELLGDGLAIAATLAFAVSIVMTRHRREISMAPATCLSQVLVLLVAAPFADPGSAQLQGSRAAGRCSGQDRSGSGSP